MDVDRQPLTISMFTPTNQNREGAMAELPLQLYKYIFPGIFFSIVMCTNSPQQDINSYDTEGLVTTIEAFNNAFAEGNVDVLSQMITADYVHTNGSSPPIDGKTWLTYLNGRTQRINSGELTILDYQMTDLRIHPINKTAVITAKITSAEVMNTDTIQNAYRVTNVWVQEDGEWKRKAFHDGKISD